MGGECSHCALPLGRRPVTATVDGKSAKFCCYGCALAQQVTRARGEHGAAGAILIRLGLAVFFAMNVMVVSLPTYVPYVYGPSAGAGDGPLFQVLRVLAMIFAAPVLLLLGFPVVRGAVLGFRTDGLNADALIVVGSTAAYGLSVANLMTGRGEVYFDTLAMLLVLVTIGRYLEAQAKADAGTAVEAGLSPVPAAACRIQAGSTTSVAPEILLAGDIVRVAPGEAFPTDGTILNGVGSVDEAMLTGESSPVLKEPGGSVAGGTCSVDGLFLVRVTAPAHESAAARIASLLAAARKERGPAQRLADRAAGLFLPAVVAVACAAGLAWSIQASVNQGVLVALSVLVVACPCALGIATPIAVWTGLVTAARQGVIVRSAPVLERAADLSRVLFDKTGTLTERTPALSAIETAAGAAVSNDDLLERAAALEEGLAHPLARSIQQAWESLASRSRRAVAGGLRIAPEAGAWAATGVQVLPGRGVRGFVAGKPTSMGSVRFAMEDLGLSRADLSRYTAATGTTVLVWEPQRILGTLHFREACRPEADSAVAALRKLGVRVGLLSGDMRGDGVVPSIIRPGEAKLGLTPEDKVAYLRELRGRPGDRKSAVHSAAPHDEPAAGGAIAMVGDGVNDAPALAAADVGIAVGSASDLARMTADIAIVSNDLSRVPWLIEYARRVKRVIRQNLFWAFAYNTAAVALATAGLLNPLVASLAMLASSFAVVANARRLRRAG